MSVSVEDMIVCRTGRKTRKKYSTKYNPKYREDFPWALPSAKGDTFAFCHFCQIDICIRSVGAKGLRDHALTCRHSHKSHSVTPSVTGLDVKSEKNVVQGYNHEQVVSHGYSNLCATSSHISASTHISTDGLLPATDHMSASSRNIPVNQLSASQLSVESLKLQQQINPIDHYGFSLQEHDPRYTTVTMGEDLGSTVVHANALSTHTLVSQSPHSSSVNNTLYTVVGEDCTTLQPLYSYPPQIHTHHDLNSRDGQTQLSCEKIQTQVIERRDLDPKTGQDVLEHGMYQSNQSSYESGSSSSHLDKSCGLSVEDLTCNVCGTVFDNWMDLKKDLLLHIKHAQEQPKRKTKSKKHTKLPKKQLYAQSDEDMLKNGTYEEIPFDREYIDDNAGDSSTITDVSVNMEHLRYPRRKGRPIGSKKKTIENLNADVEPTSVLNIPTQKINHPINQNISTHDYYVDQANAGDPHLLHTAPKCTPTTQENNEVDLPPTSRKKNNSFPCRVCQALFVTRELLKDHLKLAHNNGRPFECEVCNKFFTKKSNLEVHKKHKHTGAQNSCECNTCGKVLSTRTNLRIHMRIHEGKKPFVCKVCSKAFHRKANMEMHLAYHTGERKFTCEMCGKSFFAINALKRHRKLHTGERDYGCKICLSTYITATDLRRHMLKHNDVKPFPCNLCEKQFTRSHDLKVHLRYHNKDHRFTCPDCKKKFVESGNYRRHLRRHTGERPYVCGYCSQRFTQVHHYKVHVQQQHKNEEECSINRMNNGRNSYNTKSNIIAPSAVITPQSVSMHSNDNITTICQMVPNSRHPNIQSAPQQHTLVNVENTVQTIHSQQTHAVSNPQVTSQINSTPGGVIHQYNYVYNSNVVPNYHTIFDVCPHSQQQ